MRAPGTSDIAGYRTYKNSALCQGRVENEPMRLAKCAAPQEDKAAREVLGGALTEAQKDLQISNMGSKDSKGIVILGKDHSKRGGQLTLDLPCVSGAQRTEWGPVSWNRGNNKGKQGDGAVAEMLWGCFVTLAFVCSKKTL